MTDTTGSLPDLTTLLARAARDPALRDRLLREPHATLRAEGFPVPDDVKLNVATNDAKTSHLVLPPPETELSEAELDTVAGGGRLLDRLRARHGGRLITRERIRDFVLAIGATDP